MSITIPGKLTVKTVQGKRGSFNVADLATDIGEFQLKNPVLMKFAPGEYEGNFVIDKLKVNCYTWGSGASSYIDAILDWAELELFAQSCGFANDEEVPAQFAHGGMDPAAPTENAIILPQYAETVGHVESMIGNGYAQIALGEYLLSDRDALNHVRDMLRQAGYAFNPPTQSWQLLQ